MDDGPQVVIGLEKRGCMAVDEDQREFMGCEPLSRDDFPKDFYVQKMGSLNKNGDPTMDPKSKTKKKD